MYVWECVPHDLHKLIKVPQTVLIFHSLDLLQQPSHHLSFFSEHCYLLFHIPTGQLSSCSLVGTQQVPSVEPLTDSQGSVSTVRVFLLLRSFRENDERQHKLKQPYLFLHTKQAEQEKKNTMIISISINLKFEK